MAPATPAPYRRLLLRTFATLGVLLVLYVLSSGPAQYYQSTRWFQAINAGQIPPGTDRQWRRMYGLLERTIADTFLERPYESYLSWWFELAELHAARHVRAEVASPSGTLPSSSPAPSAVPKLNRMPSGAKVVDPTE